MLHQNFIAEMFVGKEPEASYTPDGRFVVKFPACWSRDAEEKIWFDCVIWGNITKSEKPTSKELGAFACFVSEYVKEGDRIMVFRSRIKGTATGKPRTWEDKEKIVRAATLELVVFELAVTQAKEDRPTRSPSMPASASEDLSEEENSLTTLANAPTAVQSTDVFSNYVSKISN
jgi:single-stranded DNA-binding protein